MFIPIRRRTTLIITLIITLLFNISPILTSQIDAQGASIKLVVNEKEYYAQYGKPIIQNGRTLYPLRDILNALGVSSEHIQWVSSEQTVYINMNGTQIILTIGEAEVYKDDVIFDYIEVPAQIIDGLTYLPARAVAEALSYEIGYDKASNQIRINSSTIEITDIEQAMEFDGTLLYLLGPGLTQLSNELIYEQAIDYGDEETIDRINEYQLLSMVKPEQTVPKRIEQIQYMMSDPTVEAGQTASIYLEEGSFPYKIEIDNHKVLEVTGTEESSSEIIFRGLTSGVANVKVTDRLGNSSSIPIKIQPQPNLKTWGLGVKQTEYVSIDRDYDWYIDQEDTGTYAGENCGPSATSMVIKWFDEDFDKTAEDARNTYQSKGGWWSTNDITNYLNDHDIPNKTKLGYDSGTMQDTLDQGDLIILCIDTTYLERNMVNEQRTQRFYNFSGGHFIVVKGYRVVDGVVYFETYDPNNWSATYVDQSEKGKDRYYSSDILEAAVSNWWDNHIVIERAS